MNKFWELLEKSTLVSGAVTLLLVGTACYLFAIQAPVPDLLGYALTTILGFFFGAKVQKASDAYVAAKNASAKMSEGR